MTVKKDWFWICSLLLFCLAGCTISNKPKSSSDLTSSNNPAPQLSGSLSPASTPAGSAGFSLRVAGSSFSARCVVLWNGAQRPTQIVSSTEAVATIARNDVAAAGTATISAMDTATGAQSNTVTFVITAPQATVQHQATLSWNTSSSPAAGYKVYRGTQSGGPYGLLSTGMVSADTFADTTVASGLTYFYVVTAVSSAGVESAFSNETVAVIPAP